MTPKTKPGNLNLKPDTPNPKPETLHASLATLNDDCSALLFTLEMAAWQNAQGGAVVLEAEALDPVWYSKDAIHYQVKNQPKMDFFEQDGVLYKRKLSGCTTR